MTKPIDVLASSARSSKAPGVFIQSYNSKDLCLEIHDHFPGVTGRYR